MDGERYQRPRSCSSAGQNASVAHLICNKEMSIILGDINAYHSRLDTSTIEGDSVEKLADYVKTADFTILSENEAI